MVKATKLNETQKNDLAIALARVANKASKLSQKELKEGFTSVLQDEKFKSLNKSTTARLTRVVKESEIREQIEQKCVEYIELLQTKPKRLTTGYLRFSMEQKYDADVKIPERAKFTSDAWRKLSDKKRQKYNPTDKERKEHTAKVKKYEETLKAFKTLSLA